MITGDNVETARAIAADIGLVDRRDAAIDTPDAVVLTSPKFNEQFAQLKELKDHTDLSEAEVRQRNALMGQLTGLRVLARRGRWTSTRWSSCYRSGSTSLP